MRWVGEEERLGDRKVWEGDGLLEGDGLVGEIGSGKGMGLWREMGCGCRRVGEGEWIREEAGFEEGHGLGRDKGWTRAKRLGEEMGWGER